MDPAERPYVFVAQIQKIWIMRCIDIPRDISRTIRKAASGKAMHVPVHGWIEGLPFENTLVPRGGGNYRMHVNSRIWRKLRIDAGAAVEVTLLLDTEPREPVLPPELAAGLADSPRALAIFNTLTPALRRHIIQWFDSAKQARTRDKRLQLIVRRMMERAGKQRKKQSARKKTIHRKRK
jgi:Bacteriocin-protection, YdeI or OmpD-Associated/Domain of unknown function (DUF1905)